MLFKNNKPDIKKSLVSRLNGNGSGGRYDDEYEDDMIDEHSPVRRVVPTSTQSQYETRKETPHIEEELEGQLPVDVFQTQSEIIIRAFVAGVRPDEVSVSISRDMVVIEGIREEREKVMDGDYFIRELFWGSFSRTILLPQEVDVDNSSASSRDGLLTIVMPKLDRARQTRLKVRAN